MTHARPRQRVYAEYSEPKTMAFSFGDPQTVLGSPLTDYVGLMTLDNGRYFEPPVSLVGLTQCITANAFHETALHFKKNLLCKWYMPTPAFPLKEFKRCAFDKAVYGQFYLQRLFDGFGRYVGVQHISGVNLRKLTNEKNQYLKLMPTGEEILFKPDEIIHWKDYDPQQNIYGKPDYLGSLQSSLLNEGATLFRRRYYVNGNHAGYILYTADPDMSPDTEENIKQAVSGTKGPGNFRSLFVNIPKGREKSIQVIPIGDISHKDDFERIKNITRNDILSSHRIPPALASVMPENGHAGDIEKISGVHYENEVVPMQQAVQEVNDFLPLEGQINFINV
ncbi:phage portal protein [Marinibactrum halimedae]|uniref:Portal protein n=1 Tax=Marinibactrum halimedae TaxID=1444977 RepID=A0AA37T3L5_9GAMM|nr:phage portal protein [Marinibactrum halimedae]MCD9458472.1 phage portal protein [Marinibactrum halimedae]GLS26168.1 portal protein [Marinibactrum halimedae]